MVGPFIKLRPRGRRGGLAAGAHYLDTTGEQDWVLDAQNAGATKFAEQGLLLSPGVAQMYTTGEIAANLALETPGLDTLDILVLWKGFPTYASTQTIFTILRRTGSTSSTTSTSRGITRRRASASCPASTSTALTVPWGGTWHPVWFKNDPRVSTVTVTGGVLDRAVMDGVVATTQMFEEQIQAARAGGAGGQAGRDRRAACRRACRRARTRA